MSNTPLDLVLPRHIDPRKFAQQGVAISGQLKTKDLDRLCPLLASDSGIVKADLLFGIDDQGIRNLTGEIDVELELVCQRCLEGTLQQVNASLTLGMVWTDEDASQLTKSWDPWVVGEGQIDLYKVIEDELILSLPIVAYHDYDCVAAEHFSSGDEQLDRPQASETSNPFQVLEQLKNSANDNSSENHE